MIRYCCLPLLLSLMACADPGSAPTASSLTCDHASLIVGATNNVICAIGFEDADANVESVGIRFADAAMMQVQSSSPVVGAAGITQGNAQLTLVLTPSAGGDATLSAHVVDAKGNSSNEVSLTIPCVAP